MVGAVVTIIFDSQNIDRASTDRWTHRRPIQGIGRHAKIERGTT
jgi:hypothetical protein